MQNTVVNTKVQSALNGASSAKSTDSPIRTIGASPVQSMSETKGGKEYHYPGNRRTALVIVAYNRPQYLKRTFDSLINTLASPQNAVKVDIVLSQDGFLSVLDGVVEESRKRISATLPSFSFRHIHHKQVFASRSRQI